MHAYLAAAGMGPFSLSVAGTAVGGIHLQCLKCCPNVMPSQLLGVTAGGWVWRAAHAHAPAPVPGACIAKWQLSYSQLAAATCASGCMHMVATLPRAVCCRPGMVVVAGPSLVPGIWWWWLAPLRQVAAHQLRCSCVLPPCGRACLLVGPASPA
jgi:hypothetical protein